jgi:DNA-binding NarL/FixJ family response regulator
MPIDKPPSGEWDEVRVPDLTSLELRLLPLLTTALSVVEIAQLVEMPRDEVLAQVKSIYAKLGLA